MTDTLQSRFERMLSAVVRASSDDVLRTTNIEANDPLLREMTLDELLRRAKGALSVTADGELVIDMSKQGGVE